MSLVSVIVPAHNTEAYVEEAVRSALAQTHTDVEVVVVDDGSSDSTGERIQALAADDDRVVAVHRPARGGPAVARNQGLAVARGALVSFLDADDVYRPDKTARQLAFLEQRPDVGVVFSDHEVVDESLVPVRVRRRGMPEGDMLDSLLLRNWFVITATLSRREVLDQVGGLDPRVLGGEDWDLWIRVAQVTRFGYVPGVVTSYRTRPGQRKQDIALKRRGLQSLLRQQRSLPAAQRRRLRVGAHWARAEAEWDRGSRPRAVVALARLAVAARGPTLVADVRALSHYPTEDELLG